LQHTWVHLLRLCEKHENTTDEANEDTQATGLSRLRETPVRTDELHQLLDDKSPDAFRQQLWSFVKTDHPDALVLRFLRARKWDPEKAASMLVAAANWRGKMDVDSRVVGKGEAVGLKENPSKEDREFMAQYRSGKSYVRGTDKENRPVYIVKVRLHDPKTVSGQTMEAYVLHNIESLRIGAREPNDKACLLFDLTGFGLRNMDFHLIRFIVEAFEARYPETLGCVLVHNAPFVFWGIWKVIKGWLDPVVAAKISFTSSGKDLAKFIPKDRLETCYGGQDPFTYEYREPVPGENDEMLKTEERDLIQKERDGIAEEFEKQTLRWVALDPATDEAKELSQSRAKLAEKIFDNYWRLDKFIRTRTYYDRIGAISSDGVVDFGAFAVS